MRLRISFFRIGLPAISTCAQMSCLFPEAAGLRARAKLWNHA